MSDYVVITIDNMKLKYDIDIQCCESGDIIFIDEDNKCMTCVYSEEVKKDLEKIFQYPAVEIILEEYGKITSGLNSHIFDYKIKNYTITEECKYTDFKDICNSCECLDGFKQLIETHDDYNDKMFNIVKIVFTTKCGKTLTAIVYNYSNGYYGHDLKLYSENKKIYETVL